MEEAAARCGCRERRRLLLPTVSVMVFVLGCALFYGEGYAEVARKLAGWLAPLAGPGGWHLPGTAALARARRRAGPAPFRLLFAALAGPLAGPGTPGMAAFGRLLVALDGTTLDVPATPANIAAFGAPPSGQHGAGGFPQVRVVTLTACGTRGIIDAVFRGRRVPGSSEQDLARKIARRGRLGPGMLVIADRNFGGYPVAAALAATGAALLIRVTSTRQLPVLEPLADGSYRSVLPDPAAAVRRDQRNRKRRRRGSPLPPDSRSMLPGIPVRVIVAEITITPAGGPPRTERYRLITTVADTAAAPAAQIAACYAQRWEIENSYREIKVFTRGAGRALRSQHPAGIAQETWALLCACQLTCAHRAHAAAASGQDPDRISYTVTLRAPAPSPDHRQHRRRHHHRSTRRTTATPAAPQLPTPARRQHRPPPRRTRQPHRHHHPQDHHHRPLPRHRPARPLSYGSCSS
jgi:Insertion element 4 transposase N-terminal/Transposase DDE domain